MSVFISYSKKDGAFALPLRDHLEKCGCRTWIDVHDLRPGDSAIDSIAAEIRRADYFLVVLSANSADSPWCQMELSQGMHLKVDEGSPIVLPVRIDDTPVPDVLITTVAIDARRLAPWQAADKVMETIHGERSSAVVAKIDPVQQVVATETPRRRVLQEIVVGLATCLAASLPGPISPPVIGVQVEDPVLGDVPYLYLPYA